MNAVSRIVARGALLAAVAGTAAFAQRTATVSGTTRDVQTGEALPGANIVLVGTGFGAVSDAAGRYIVRSVAAGSYTVRVTYIGYRTAVSPLSLEEGADIRKDFALTPVTLEGETVVVTAQAAGQNEAINQQLSAMPVMNVVSAARIQELPDANAAESVGRLPGVSLIRTGGEGSKVVIRGLSPQYNQITVEGVELASNVNSANNIVSGDANQSETTASLLGDRGMDLSMISSSMLGGIEVIKAITPDMDAAVMGGVVNFGMRKAAKGAAAGGGPESWLPRFDALSQGGYNDLKKTYRDYKFVGSAERRFWDDRLGVFVQATAERRNLSDNELGVDYTLNDKDHGDAGIPDLTRLSMADVVRTRERLGGTVVLDYQHPTGEVGLMNTASWSTTRALRNEEAMRWLQNDITFTADETDNRLALISNILSVKQDISFLHIDLRASHNYSESNDPEDLDFSFWQQRDAGFQNLGDISKLAPATLARLATPNPLESVFSSISISSVLTRERTWSGSLDVESPLPLPGSLAAKLKVGGAMQYRTRSYDNNVESGGNWWLGGVAPLLVLYPSYALPGTNLMGMPAFVDGSYAPGSFLGGEYPLPYEVKTGPMHQVLDFFQRSMSPDNGYTANKLESVFNNYSGNEMKTAGFAMLTVNVGDDITILPGVRYQNLTTTYTAMRGRAVPGGIQGNDTTVTQRHGYFLPMAHVRYQPLEWLQVHAAYTNTLNYPDYSTITPRYYVGQAAIYYNNFRLKPARSENMDLVLSIHSNEIGLLTVDGFRKRITDLIFFSREYLTDFSAYPDLPRLSGQIYEFDTYINNPIPVTVTGIETEWQTNLWYLPDPFSGLVFNVNYTHIFSQATYPRSVVNTTYAEDGSVTSTVVDAPYTTRLLDQPDDIVNLSVGYDYRGFSARLSMLAVDNIFKRPDFWMQNRVISARMTRWDVALKQDLPWFGIQLFLFLNNITGTREVDVNERTLFPASEQAYAMTADLGLRVRF